MPYLQAPGVNNPFGFQPVEGPLPAQTHIYYVGTSAASHPSGNGTFAVLPGDVVTLSTDNTLWVATSGGISLTGTDALGRGIVGVAAQAVLQSNAAWTPCLVYDDPNQVFVVQDDGSATAGMGSSNNEAIGAMIQFNATATGGNSQATGNTARSAMTLRASRGTVNTSRVLSVTGASMLPIQVLAIHPIEYTPNAPASTIVPTASGAWRKWLVKFNQHMWAVRPG